MLNNMASKAVVWGGRWTHVTTSTDATHAGRWVGRGERRPTQNARKH
jgi:hypothetical protein